jgi:hypothetical protein
MSGTNLYMRKKYKMRTSTATAVAMMYDLMFFIYGFLLCAWAEPRRVQVSTSKCKEL